MGSNIIKFKDFKIQVQPEFKVFDQKHRPCARDGHTCDLNGSQMVVFGGDRHMMRFNDLYVIDVIL